MLPPGIGASVGVLVPSLREEQNYHEAEAQALGAIVRRFGPVAQTARNDLPVESHSLNSLLEPNCHRRERSTHPDIEPEGRVSRAAELIDIQHAVSGQQ
jgi:hypothetical protein